uniref:Histonelysine Nmethyltransferase EHMT1like [Hydra vulgaris] n=1 Tax=Lepeophtheirus salmonis TaxID=72036 RepID=A0A0K2T3I9_LEPSM
MLVEAYGEHALSRAQCFRLFEKFYRGDFDVRNEIENDNLTCLHRWATHSMINSSIITLKPKNWINGWFAAKDEQFFFGKASINCLKDGKDCAASEGAYFDHKRSNVVHSPCIECPLKH